MGNDGYVAYALGPDRQALIPLVLIAINRRRFSNGRLAMPRQRYQRSHELASPSTSAMYSQGATAHPRQHRARVYCRLVLALSVLCPTGCCLTLGSLDYLMPLPLVRHRFRARFARFSFCVARFTDFTGQDPGAGPQQSV